MPQFDPSTFSSQLFWLLICFGILIGAFVFIFVPRINNLLEDRSKKVRHDLERTNQVNDQIRDLLKSRQERLSLAEKRAEDIIQKTLDDMEKKKTQQIQKAEAKLNATIQAMKTSIEEERRSFEASLKPLVIDCARQLLPKFLGDLESAPLKAKQKKVP